MSATIVYVVEVVVVFVCSFIYLLFSFLTSLKVRVLGKKKIEITH